MHPDDYLTVGDLNTDYASATTGSFATLYLSDGATAGSRR